MVCWRLITIFLQSVENPNSGSDEFSSESSASSSPGNKDVGNMASGGPLPTLHEGLEFSMHAQPQMLLTPGDRRPFYSLSLKYWFLLSFCDCSRNGKRQYGLPHPYASSHQRYVAKVSETPRSGHSSEVGGFRRVSVNRNAVTLSLSDALVFFFLF